MSLRKLAGSIAALGLVVGLFGAGIGAQFTDNASATTTIHVGTFDISLSSPTSGAVVTCPVGFDSCTVTLDKNINDSAPGSAPLAIVVNNLGTIAGDDPRHRHRPSPAPFSDLLGSVADFPLAAGASHQLDAGLSWTELGNPQLEHRLQHHLHDHRFGVGRVLSIAQEKGDSHEPP